MFRRTVLCLVAFLCLDGIGVDAQVKKSPDERKLLDLVNEERERIGIPKLAWSEQLSESARGHAFLLAQRGKLSHQLEGEPFLSDRIAATGLRFDSSAENVATAYSVEEGHEALMRSPPHRASILNADYNALGVAIIARGDQLYFVENFARTVPTYTAKQFREAVIATFNRERKSRGHLALDSRPDAKLDEVACSSNPDAQQVISRVREANEVVIFTNSVPEKLPAPMLKASGESKLDRMNVGVCFIPSGEQGYANFRVVVAFLSPHY